MLSPHTSLLGRIGVALEAAGVLGFLATIAATMTRVWPMSLIPEDASPVYMLGFAMLGATGAVLGSKAKKANRL